MSRNRILPLTAILLFLSIASGCGGAAVRVVPINVRYTHVRTVPPRPAALATIALGAVRDVRRRRDADIVGERIYYDNKKDRFLVKNGLANSISGIIRGFYEKRGVRLVTSRWAGQINRIWDERGDIVISVKITNLWFSSQDSVFQSQAESDLRLVLKVGSPRSGMVITKTVRIEPAKKSNIFWNTKDVENWLNESLSDAIERVLPEIEQRLAN